MRRLILIAMAVGLAGCMSTKQMVASAKAEFVGKPVAERYQALGQPETVVRVAPDRIAHTWSRSGESTTGGNIIVVGQTAIRTPTSTSTQTCRATYITKASSDAMPLYQQIIVDVQSPGCG